MSDGNISFHRDVVPKIHDIIRLTLLSVREKWERGEGSSYRFVQWFASLIILYFLDLLVSLDMILC